MGSVAIPLQIQQPQIESPLQTIGGLMQLRGQMTEMALRQAQIQQANQATQNLQAEQTQKNRDIADQNTVQDAEKDPAAWGKILSGDLSPLAGKVQDKTIQSLRSNINTALQNEATRTGEQLTQRGTAAKTIGENIGTALQTQRKPDGSLDVDKVNELLPGFVQGHLPELKVLGVDPSTIPTSVADEDHLNLIASRVNGFTSMVNAAQGLKKEQAATAQAAATASKDTADANLNNFKLNLMKGMDANTVADGVDALIDPAKYPQANKDAHAAAAVARLSGDPAKVAEAVKSVYDEQVGKPAGAAATVAAETGPKIEQARKMIPVDASRAAAVASAEQPVHQAEASYQNALQQGDKASADYFGSLKEAKQAIATSKTIQEVLDLSKQTGNPVAMQQLKAMVPEFTNAAQQIKRMSGGQNTGLSSALDNAVNEFTSMGGKPLSDSTMKAIAPYVKTIANGAVQQHNANVQALSQAYPQKQFAPEPVPYAHVGGHFVGESVKLKNGSTVKITKVLPNDQFEYE